MRNVEDEKERKVDGEIVGRGCLRFFETCVHLISLIDEGRFNV